MIRKPIITVLGHVDAGKTAFLDKIRGTVVAQREAGGITQHIGATEVPIEIINEISGELIQKYGFKISLPGLLFIDTPGHEAFTNLRKRGGSIADLAILVVDVSKGLQPQTIEAIEILRSFKTAFIVALNKIDKMHGWIPQENSSITNSLKVQNQPVLEQLDTKLYEVVGQLHQHGFASERFDRCKDLTKEIPIVPSSAKTGEGIPETLMFLAGLSQKYLEEKLKIKVSGAGKASVLEVKEEKGLGKTMDVILYDGSIKTGQEIVVMGKTGLIKAKVRALLKPKELDEIRDPKEKFKSVKEIHAAAGIKIAAPGAEDVIAGSPLMVVETGKEGKEIEKEIQALRIDTQAVGPIIRTDALGGLEALIKLLEKEDIKVHSADIGEVTRKDIIEAESIKEKDSFLGVVFAFHTKVMNDASEQAKKSRVKIFQNNVIYKLIEDYKEWVKTEKENTRKQKLENIILPAKIRILKNHVFRNSKPAIVGIRVIEGKLKNNVEVMKKGKVIGRIHAIQADGENLKEAKKGKEVAVSIEGGVIGRNIEEGDDLYSFIPKTHLMQLNELSDSFSEEELELLEEIKKMETIKQKALAVKEV